MRSVIISLVLLVLIICTIYFSAQYIRISANDMAFNIEKVMMDIQDEKWDIAQNNYIQNMDKWYEISKVYNSLIHHNEVDNISIHMEELDKYIKLQEKSEALATASVLRFLFEHLPKSTQATWGNIL